MKYIKIKTIISKLKILKDKFLKEIFPEDISCFYCSSEIKEQNKYHLCKDCFSKIKPIKYPCKVCGNELNSFTFYCESCKNNKRYFDYVSSATIYDDIAKKMVHKLKFYGQKYLAKTISAFLIDTFNNGKYDLIDLVICVPILKRNLKERKYNQAEELLKEFIKVYKFDYSLNCLEVIKEVPMQINLSKLDREENLKGVFRVVDNDLVKGKNILVIDDVITTGSTLNEIAKVLKESGAGKVYGLTFCHTTINKDKKA